MNSEVSVKLNEYGSDTEEYLVNYFSNYPDIPEKLRESMLYSINAGGKRLRPSLLLGTFSTFSDRDYKEVIPFAASIEMIHTYSLIHDDLPSMDDDDLRRGKPSNHIIYGESGAILAGDALLNSAIEIIISSLIFNISESKLKSASIIMKASGASGMIGGQVLDIKGAYDQESLNKMHNMKTGALIKSAILAGGILGGCSNEDEINLTEYALNLGCAFQIKDDILDVESTSDILGKPVGSDNKNDKTTYTSLYGLEEAKSILNQKINDALDSLSKINRNTGFLESIAVFIRDRRD